MLNVPDKSGYSYTPSLDLTGFKKPLGLLVISNPVKSEYSLRCD